jgi:hypothetical protein
VFHSQPHKETKEKLKKEQQVVVAEKIDKAMGYLYF